LILFNGVFAMAELAILTAKRLRLETAAEQGLVAGHVEDANGSEHGYAFGMFLGDG
jgi:CBS domain containing-hemolysin-like protein